LIVVSVRGDVVQLARDAQPLLLDSAQCLLLAALLRQLQPLEEQRHVRAAGSQRLGGEQRYGDEGDVAERREPGGMACEGDVGGDDGACGADRRGELQGATPREADCIEGHSGRDDGGCTGTVVDSEQDEDERPGSGEREHRGRAPSGQHGRRGKGESERERSHAGVAANDDPGGSDGADDREDGRIDDEQKVAAHTANLAARARLCVLREE
jgi:hypothetical protein